MSEIADTAIPPMPDPVETPRYRAAQVIARYDWEHGLSANGEPGRHTFGEIDALLDHPDILRELAESAAPVDTTPDLGNRGELVDVLDMYMRLDDRADAERVADALIARPALLRALSSRAASTCTTLLGVPLDVSDALGPYGWRTLDMFGGALASGVCTPTSPLDGNTPEAPDA